MIKAIARRVQVSLGVAFLRTAVFAITRNLLEAIFPEKCPMCDALLMDATRRGVCPACEAATQWIAQPLAIARFPKPRWDEAHSACRFDGPIKQAIHRFKYEQRSDLAKNLSRLMHPLPDVDLIIPVPLAAARLRQRGYNQSQLLAKYLGKHQGLPILTHTLRRVRETPPQVGLELSERLANLRGAFAMAPQARAELTGQRILLIDDVLTTGATLHEACRTLRQAKPTSITVATLAIVT